MPSTVLAKFEGAMMRDVDRIIDTHSTIQNGSRGNMALGHLTRSGVLLLCAAWELYIEELLVEAVRVSIDRCSTPDALPQRVRLTIADFVRESKHQLKPLQMAGDGWETIYLEVANKWVSDLNSPKSHNIDEMFLKIVGIENLSASWSHGAVAVNNFVAARGDVAHRGSDAGNIHMNVLRDTYKPQICRTAIETDNAISTYIRASYEPREYPWNRRTLPP
ncbi:hypothetical protein FFK22_002205 [Mycobacterium sp. KBS0706]|uniref:HEPN domain-containing protein n=1 Tax=Mycobacterium sp. KBS0706 TaxID=2578109 RepID=UPI00110FC249|nr:HEPN domain-containing protein [Mycobacterium sp. KBS0706]TSD90286.1 hypothetical protein FFK22_002205 [Mycobacterium sp. KBS0706]